MFKFSDEALKKSANKYGSQNEKSAAEIEEQIIKRSRTRVCVMVYQIKAKQMRNKYLINNKAKNSF